MNLILIFHITPILLLFSYDTRNNTSSFWPTWPQSVLYITQSVLYFHLRLIKFYTYS